jgi:phosphate starvation-inducible PhoH-like protein
MTTKRSRTPAVASNDNKRVSRYKGAEEEQALKQVLLKAYNDNQKLYLNALETSQQTIVLGPAGTGKTFMAATHAANLYLAKKIHKIVVTRPNVPVGNDLGFLPGTLQEKFAPWAAPVMDVLNKHMGIGVVESALKHGNIETAPLSTMRGRSFDNAFMLCDEVQNTSVEEIKMLLTRVGKNTRVVLNGDITQSDIKGGSGLDKILYLSKKHNMGIPVIEFGIDDIVRSDICKQWIIAFTKEGL